MLQSILGKGKNPPLFSPMVFVTLMVHQYLFIFILLLIDKD